MVLKIISNKKSKKKVKFKLQKFILTFQLSKEEDETFTAIILKKISSKKI